MSYRIEKETGDLIISGFEKGIASSPLQGIASIKNANITTETGEVMCNYKRNQQSVTPFTSTLTIQAATASTLTWIAGQVPFVGEAIQVTTSTITNFTNVTGSGGGPIFFIVSVSGSGTYTIGVSKTYGGVAISNLGVTGAASFASVDISQPIASATEKYYDGSQIQNRYYVLDSIGYVWLQDTAITTITWSLIDASLLPNASGIAVLNGYLIAFQPGSMYTKETVNLGVAWTTTAMNSSLNTISQGNKNPHFCLVGHESLLNYTDSNYIGTVQPFSSTSSTVPNIWSYGSYTEAANVLTISILIGGNFPAVGQAITFTPANGGTLDTAISQNTVYYVIATGYSAAFGTFEISATIGGSSVAWNHDSTGTQYYNSFNPHNGTVDEIILGGSGSTFIGTSRACQLPDGEIAQSLAELGTTLIIGTKGNTLYQWDEVSTQPTNFIPLAENNTVFLLTVNNVVFAFTGQKGNIYVTSGSAASGVLTVPDYLAGIPGTPSSYIEPYFTWGQAFFARGRVFFSIQDQTSAKTGNCGGIYSFVPSFYNAVSGTDVGTALRLENFNSYGTYNGLANVLFPSQNQSANGVQYYSAWTSSVSGATYGIDFSSTSPYVGGETLIETDLIATGEILGGQKETKSNVEFKVSAPLASGESLAINYRLNGTSAYATIGTVIYDNSTQVGALSGYITPLPFQNTQWLQFQIVLTSTATTPSFTRLTELRIR